MAELIKSREQLGHENDAQPPLVLLLFLLLSLEATLYPYQEALWGPCLK